MIGKYLDGFKDKGIVYNPNTSLVLEHFADAIEQQFTPNISLLNGTEALKVAHAILNCF